jgi:hypothetical protein
MTKKVYMIVPDTTYPFDSGKFHSYIKSLYTSGYINAWWHYLPGGLYFVDTSLEVNQLYNLIIKGIPLRKHIIMEVNPNNQQGWLSKEAWDWFGPYQN